MSSDARATQPEQVLDSNYEIIKSDKGDLIGLFDTNKEDYDAFQRGSEEQPVDPESVPLVIHTNGEIMEGYFPDSVGSEEAYEAGKAYFSEDSIFHLKSDQDRWGQSVRILLSEKREEVVGENKSSSIRNAYTRPIGGISPAAGDNPENYDATTGWDWS